MTDPRERLRVDLDLLPAVTFAAVVEYLDGVLRECQLVTVSAQQGEAPDPSLLTLANGLVPDIEEIDDAFQASEITTNDDGSLHLVGSLTFGQSGMLTHLHMQLVQLRLLGRRGGLLLESDPQVTQLMTWIWDELGDQLHGRAPRPYRPAT